MPQRYETIDQAGCDILTLISNQYFRCLCLNYSSWCEE